MGFNKLVIYIDKRDHWIIYYVFLEKNTFIAFFI